MNNQPRTAAWSLAVAALGLGGMAAAPWLGPRLGETAAGLIGALGFAAAVLSSFVLGMALLAWFGQARLRRGEGVIARWRLSAAEWERFRAFDAQRSDEDPALLNELIIRPVTPPDGVEVTFGRRQVMVDGSYHALSGIPHVAAVSWLSAPADPECLEFALVYPRGRFGGVRRMSLRVPVPAAAREEGVRIYWHFHAKAPQPRPGLVYRRPRAVFAGCAVVALTAAAIGAPAMRACQRGPCSDTVMAAAAAGLATAGATLLVMLILAVVLWRTAAARAPDG